MYVAYAQAAGMRVVVLFWALLAAHAAALADGVVESNAAQRWGNVVCPTSDDCTAAH